jgi:predicted membrane GTPase involved in stress response
VTKPDQPGALPMLKVDEPTLTMNFCVNTSPLAQPPKTEYVTSARSGTACRKGAATQR